MVVSNPDPELFKHAFVTLESETELLKTTWDSNHRTLTIYLPDQVYKPVKPIMSFFLQVST